MAEGRFARRFGARSTTADVLSGVDLKGRTGVVTGPTGGLGFETARSLASVGARVILAGRDVERGAATELSVRSESGNQDVHFLELDLADLESVRRFASNLPEYVDCVDLLINNAAVMACPFWRSKDGHEMQLATNHLGHFLLTLELLPLLRRSDRCRVVCVSSGAHWMGGVDLEDIDFRVRPYDPWAAYGQSKTANALFALEFQRRLGSPGLTAYSLHPGAIGTDLGRHVVASNAKPVAAELMKTIPQGAATQVFAAVAPELEGYGGRYLEDCGLAMARNEPDRGSTALACAPHARDPQVAERLWDLSCELVGIENVDGMD